jgi:hypothetical protein
VLSAQLLGVPGLCLAGLRLLGAGRIEVLYRPAVPLDGVRTTAACGVIR